MSPEEIEALFRDTATTAVSTGDEEELALSEDERKYRTELLAGVVLAAQQAWLAGSDEIDLIAEKLGDGSRDPSWRLPLGDSGLLDLFLRIIATGELRPSLEIHALRVIGNSCADTDENRARLVEAKRLPDVARLLGDDSILAFAIPVLYNICVDYEPAQLQACEAGLSRALVDILSGPRLLQCEAFVNIICKILALLVPHAPELQTANPLTPLVLLQVATNPTRLVDLEDFSGLVSVALAYLAHEAFQTCLLEAGGVSTLLAAFATSYTHYDAADADPAEAAALDNIRIAFVQVFADISALEAFPSAHPLGSPAVQTLRSWLMSASSYPNLQTAACLALGNLARSDESSTSLVRDYHIHVPLISLVSAPHAGQGITGAAASPTAPPSQLLHAALSFLKNLAIPAANKPVLGALLLDPPAGGALPRLWASTDAQPQAQFAAVSLARLLLIGCPANVRRLCAPLSPDPASPAHDRSNLHVLCGVFDRADAEPTKMEAARAVTQVCRALHSTPVLPILPEGWHTGDGGYVFKGARPSDAAAAAPQAGESRRARFYDTHADIYKPLSFLVQQRKFPALRSETWFVFALMARSQDGVAVVMRALNPSGACRALVEAVTGKDMVDGHDPLAGALSLSAPEDGGASAAGVEAAGNAGSGSSGDGEGLEGLGLEPQQADPAQAAGMAKVDRENGLVLIAEVLKQYRDDAHPYRRGVFEELLRTGGQLVLHQRLQDKEASSE